ncbi:MAG TPA: hypothetical protein VGC95_09320, partial [Chitinophagaceae bacterium]
MVNALQRTLAGLTGLHYGKEYVCLPADALHGRLHVYLTGEGFPPVNITGGYAFTGYSPLIMAIESASLPADHETIRLAFVESHVHVNEKTLLKDAIGSMVLRKIRVMGSAVFYGGVSATHRMLSLPRQECLHLYNRLYNRRPGNVFLKGNLYTQVQLAYA